MCTRTVVRKLIEGDGIVRGRQATFSRSEILTVEPSGFELGRAFEARKAWCIAQRDEHDRKKVSDSSPRGAVFEEEEDGEDEGEDEAA